MLGETNSRFSWARLPKVTSSHRCKDTVRLVNFYRMFILEEDRLTLHLLFILYAKILRKKHPRNIDNI